MVTITVHCSQCQSDALVRNSHAPNGKQMYRCRTCGRQGRENPTPHAHPQTRREEILHAYQEHSSLRGLMRTFGVPRTTVSSWIKKSSSASPLWTTLLAPDPYDPTCTILELDERMARLCSQKPTTSGCGWPCAVRRGKGSPMPWEIGAKRRVSGCGRPFQTAIARGHCFTDFWAAYAAVIPKEQHTAVGKETGETAHVERWNNTLRQRLARFVRMTLSFSKSVLMHEACLLLFLHRYNTERAILLK